jgi:hypothetical protein
MTGPIFGRNLTAASSRKWNAEAKDRLEHLVCEMVCDKQLDLATTQKAIAKDWIAVYRKVW